VYGFEGICSYFFFDQKVGGRHVIGMWSADDRHNSSEKEPITFLSQSEQHPITVFVIGLK
jgi:hypothetical protein